MPATAVPSTLPKLPDSITAAVSELATGSTLQFPMSDVDGVLLLAGGAVITPEFQRLLEARQVTRVTVNAADTAAFRSARRVPPRNDAPLLDENASREIQQAVHRWVSVAGNRGTALRQRVSRPGPAVYDRAFVTELRQQSLRTSASLMVMMHQTQTGRFTQVATTAFAAVQSSLQFLTADVDALMAERLVGCPDSALARHCLRMARLAMAIATEMELNAENVQRIGVTALMHDWGMLRVPESIRTATEPPQRWDRLEVERHVAYTADLLDKLDGLPSMVPLISYQVHEKLDGTGYPRRKNDATIHLFARILHIADDYVTLTTPQGWRPAVLPYAAITGMLRQAHGRASDPQVLRALLRVLSLFPIGSGVRLNDGSEATVLRSNGDRYTEPIVRRTLTADGTAIPETSPDAVLSLTGSGFTIEAALDAPGEEELRYIPDPDTVYRHDTEAASIPAPKWRGSVRRQSRAKGQRSRGG